MVTAHQHQSRAQPGTPNTSSAGTSHWAPLQSLLPQSPQHPFRRKSWTKKTQRHPVQTNFYPDSANTHVHTHKNMHAHNGRMDMRVCICTHTHTQNTLSPSSVQLRQRGWGCGWSALCSLLLLTFLSAALLGHVFFALVKWKLSREAETLFTFRFDRLWKNMKMEGKDRRKKKQNNGF